MNEDDDLDQPPTRASTRMTRYTVDVPKAAVAGLVGEMAERLDDIQDEVDRCKPVSQAWSAIGDVYIGCKGGQIIKVQIGSLEFEENLNNFYLTAHFQYYLLFLQFTSDYMYYAKSFVTIFAFSVQLQHTHPYSNNIHCSPCYLW